MYSALFGMHDKDYELLQSVIHKMIPSFTIIGINSNFEIMAKLIHENASKLINLEDTANLVLKLGNVCEQACDELKEELIKIKNTIE